MEMKQYYKLNHMRKYPVKHLTQINSLINDNDLTIAAALRTGIALSVRPTLAALYTSLCTLEAAVPIPAVI